MSVPYHVGMDAHGTICQAPDVHHGFIGRDVRWAHQPRLALGSAAASKFILLGVIVKYLADNLPSFFGLEQRQVISEAAALKIVDDLHRRHIVRYIDGDDFGIKGGAVGKRSRRDTVRHELFHGIPFQNAFVLADQPSVREPA